MLSMHKWVAARKHVFCSQETVFFLAIACSDGNYYAQYDRNYEWSLPLKMGWRADRNDPQDKEPCVFLPMDEFIKMERKTE